ncbi:MAG: hypothetical protein ACHQ52_05010 [Candidatus Eisenbacteria bacterium]
MLGSMPFARTRWFLVAALASLFAASSLVAPPARAAKLYQGDHLTIAESDTIHDDVYACGGNVIIQGVVDGDVVACGGKIRIDGSVIGSVLAAGGDIDVRGDVAGSIRAAGGNIMVGARVGRDLVVGGGKVMLMSDGIVHRDVLLGCGQATIVGTIARNARIGCGQLVLGSTANIGGDLTYGSDRSMTRAAGAVVGGKTTWYAENWKEHHRSMAERILAKVVHRVRELVGIVLLGLLFVLFFPRFAQRTLEKLATQPLPSAGAGLLACVALPVAAMTIFIIGFMIGGWWIGAALIVGWLFALAVGSVIASMTLGRWISARLGQTGLALAWALVVGAVVLMLVGFIPILGGLVCFVATLAGAGALMMSIGAGISAGRAKPVAQG